MESSQLPTRLHKVAHQGHTVCWYQTGDGPPLVLLHGGHGSAQHWLRNVAALSTRYTVWVPDMPGYGGSDVPPESTLASLTNLLQATLDALIGPTTGFSLVGFSFGSLVATQLAVQRPSVERLAMLGAAGHGGIRRPQGDLLPWRASLQSGDAQAVESVMRHNLAAHMLHDPASIDAQALSVHTDACLQTRFYSKSISRAATLRPLLAQYTGPLLLVWGEHDVTAQPDVMARSLSEGRTDCQTHVLPGAGHWVQYERAEAVNQLLLDWL